MGWKSKQKPVSRSTAPQRVIVMIDSETGLKYWYIVVGVTILFKGPKRGLSKIMIYFTFDYWVGKLNKKPMSLGIAPQRLIVMIDSDTGLKYWSIQVGVTIPLKGPKRGLSKIIIYFTFYSLGRKTEKKKKNVCLVVLPNKGSLS